MVKAIPNLADTMRKILFVIIAFLSCRLIAEPAPRHEYPDYIGRLDSLIEKKDVMEKEKLVRIADASQKARNAVTANDRYLYNSLLFEEYSTYRADSALKYINKNIDIAQQTGNTEWKAMAHINKSTLLTATGLLKEAEDEMRKIDRASLPEELLAKYYGQMIYLYSHLGNYTGGSTNEYYIKERAYKDSIMSVITPEDPDYLWYKGWDILGTEKADSTIIPALEAKLANSSFNSRADAKNFYVLSKLYEWQGDMENYKKYMALSAITDVKLANAEIASLEELAKIMYDKGNGDIDHAYSYINYSLNKAISLPNRVRAFGIARTLDDVNHAYQERNKRQEKRIRFFLTLVCILAALSIATVVIIIIQNKRLKRQKSNLDTANKSLNSHLEELSEAQKQLAEANAQLKQLNNDLHSKNEELKEANFVKEEYIGYVFAICSSYISKLEDFRKSIHVKAVTRKYKEIEDSTSPGDMMKEELKEFYRSFDTIFLNIYPDFINDFNALLQPDKRITPKENELLNTELRIYALVRLGINDSVKIAEFLHCSPQTVYNNRFRVRNKAIVPKEDFAETVRKLGKYISHPS